MNDSDRFFLTAVWFLTITSVLAAAYIFLVRKDYNFIVEAPCDQVQGTCFYRDCSESECPANELEYYRVFSVRAKDFATCADNTCLQECLLNTIACTETLCGESDEDTCADSLVVIEQ